MRFVEVFFFSSNSPSWSYYTFPKAIRNLKEIFVESFQFKNYSPDVQNTRESIRKKEDGTWTKSICIADSHCFLMDYCFKGCSNGLKFKKKQWTTPRCPGHQGFSIPWCPGC